MKLPYELSTAIRAPRWMQCAAFLDAWYRRRIYKQILQSRSIELVRQEWLAKGLEWSGAIEDVSSVIARECDWPNNLFLPCDDAAVLFWPYGTDLGDVSAIQRLATSKLLVNRTAIYDRIISMTFGDFVVREIIGISKK